jgi:hypothetical protein
VGCGDSLAKNLLAPFSALGLGARRAHSAMGGRLPQILFFKKENRKKNASGHAPLESSLERLRRRPHCVFFATI